MLNLSFSAYIWQKHELASSELAKRATRGQFHQHFTLAFLLISFFQKNYKAKMQQRKAAQSTFVQKNSRLKC